MRTFYDHVMRNRASAIALGLLAALATTLMVSWPALNGPFLFDDFPNLEHLASLDGHLDWGSLANYASLYDSGEPGRPLSMLSFVINDFDWPSDPWGFKYTNLMLHLMAGVLVFGLARSLARLRIDSPRADLIALLAMAAWLLHPMQLSTSMLVVQRMTQLSALFAITAVWGYLAIASRAKSVVGAMTAILALGIGTILATLSKETGALAPLLAVAINSTLLWKRLQPLPPITRRLLQWGSALPVIALAAVLSQLSISAGYAYRPFTLGQRLLTETRVLCAYLYNIVVPNLRGGGIYHDDFTVSYGLLDPWSTLLAVLFVTGTLITVLLCRRKWPVLAFAVLWYFAGHVLESTVIPLELYFEHRNYLPMFGILFALAFWAVEAPPRRRKLALTMACLWLAFAAWLTSVQAPIWGNRGALVRVWAIEHPQSPRAVQQSSAYYYGMGQKERAADTLLDGYARGVRGSDFPAQVLLLACYTDDESLAERSWDLLHASLRFGESNRALPVTMQKLRIAVEDRRCPEMLTEDGWLALTMTLLSNPNYQGGSAAAYLRVERAYLFTHRRNLNSAMLELEKAWAANPTPALAQLAAATLASAGLYDEARTWGMRALAHQATGVRGWLSNDDVKSKLILDALGKAQASQSPKPVKP